MMTEKENYIRFLRGQETDSLPYLNIMSMITPSCFNRDRTPDMGGFDTWGVEWVPDKAAMGGAINKPGQYLFEDVTEWRDHIKMPDYSDVDWEIMAKKDLEGRPPGLPNLLGTGSPGFFLSLMTFMGFTNGLISFYEEPEETKALLNFLCDVYVEHAKLIIKHYSPDAFWFPDDIAHEASPFVSLEIFREFFAPCWKRLIDLFLAEDIPVQMHICGHIEPFLDDIVEMGVCAWDPAQPSNDLLGIKKKYGKKLAIIGGTDNLKMQLPSSTEEDIRAEVKNTIETLAPGGGYGFQAFIMGDMEDPVTLMKNAWVMEEYEKLKMQYHNI